MEDSQRAKKHAASEEPKDKKGAMYHVALTKEDVGEIAFLPGDPARVNKIAAYFKDPHEVAFHREFKTWGGYIGKKYVTATSTGIGGPAIAIVIEELARLGVKTMIRIGTCGTIRGDIPVGSQIIADAAVRLDGTSKQYVMEGYPAAASPEVSIALKTSAERLKKNFTMGIIATTDSFYVGQGREGFNNYYPERSKNLVKTLQGANVLGFSMEEATLFTLGRLYGLRTGATFAVIANRVTKEFRVDAGVDGAIEIAVDAVKHL